MTFLFRVTFNFQAGSVSCPPPSTARTMRAAEWRIRYARASLRATPFSQRRCSSSTRSLEMLSLSVVNTNKQQLAPPLAPPPPVFPSARERLTGEGKGISHIMRGRSQPFRRDPSGSRRFLPKKSNLFIMSKTRRSRRATFLMRSALRASGRVLSRKAVSSNQLILLNATYFEVQSQSLFTGEFSDPPPLPSRCNLGCKIYL